MDKHNRREEEEGGGKEVLTEKGGHEINTHTHTDGAAAFSAACSTSTFEDFFHNQTATSKPCE